MSRLLAPPSTAARDAIAIDLFGGLCRVYLGLEVIVLLAFVTYGMYVNPTDAKVSVIALCMGFFFTSLTIALLCFGWAYIGWSLRIRAHQQKQQALREIQIQLEQLFPETRATPLSSGKWLLTSRVTGKTVDEVDGPATPT